jgi:CDP-diacylglycerol---glycerol-3-phosphate 3-phosphatidyltransferase
MPFIEPRAIPNAITLGRVILAPAVFFLLLVDGFWPRLLAFVLFLAAAFSDLWDGYLARKHGWISDFGKLMDPLADKLLVVATFVPFYLISQSPEPSARFPYWGSLPGWVLVVIFGRELLVTVIRQLAARRGRVIPAGKEGKLKAVFQNIFCGVAIFWYALQSAASAQGWTGRFWEIWQAWLHAPVLMISLIIALVLTVYSMLVYLLSWWRPGAERAP